MRRLSFKAQLLSLVAVCGITMVFTACTNEDVAQNAKNNDEVKGLTTFTTGEEATTRTSMDNSGAFYWEAGDKIYVKDDENHWQVSSNAPTSKTASFRFKVPGKYTKGNTYEIYYPGKNGYQDQVTISASQTQTKPNSTAHFGEAGDCGTATASWSATQNGYAFKLDHQAAYLIFQPYISNTKLDDCYLTKIEVSSDNDITDTYKLDTTTGALTGGSGTGKQIVITTKGSESYANGFHLNVTSANVATNGTFMVIKPGTHNLTIKYWIKDVKTKVEGVITKVLNTTFVKNKYYNITADLKVTDYDGDHYYMWDAQQQCWFGYEWTKNLSIGIGQPTVNNNTSSNYPASISDARYFNPYYPGALISNPATRNPLVKTLPNANELSWYVLKGDPRWDDVKLWTVMGHLYKGGMWFLKKENIQHFSKEHAPDGVTDLRSRNVVYDNYTLTSGIPNSTDITKYFYLPALGMYGKRNTLDPTGLGTLTEVGVSGHYWSSSAYPVPSGLAYGMGLSKGHVGVSGYLRGAGIRAKAF